MKLVLSIICGLLLAFAPATNLQASPVCAAMASHHSCGCGGKMPCCAQRSVPQPNSTPLATVNAGGQMQNIVPPSSVIACLPTLGAISISSSAPESVPVFYGAPLYQRNCVFLI